MAVYPNSFNGKERLQPGARGEIFQTDIPGYRDGADRMNRSNNKLAVSEHDVPNCEYELDRRLLPLFKYGFAYGFNQIVVPKGRAVAVDPHMNLINPDMKKQRNALTLANGGVPVRLRAIGDKFKSGGSAIGLVGTEAKGTQMAGVGKEWTPIIGQDDAYEDTVYRPFKTAAGGKQLVDAGFTIDSATGKVSLSGNVTNTVRAGNIPIGIIQRNEYTKDDDALNGIMPGPILTEALLELPLFAFKNKAEQNPWGSAYGNLLPGCLVKSDENGRFVLSPLSVESIVATMTISEYEAERQQVLGQIYSVDNELVPAGAAKWATWSLEERLGFEDFNPSLYRQNGRTGEDTVNNSPYKSTGEYPGFPYDKAYMESDLHMLASGGRDGVYNQRMNAEYQYENLGIPGLTDGKNVASRSYPAQVSGKIHYAGENEYVDMFFRTSEVDLEKGSLQISVGGEAFTNCVPGADLTVSGQQFLQVKYADELQGVIVLTVTNKAKADTVLGALPTKSIDVKFKFSKRGLAGVPTFLDWDGAVGSVRILLTK